MFFKCTWEIRTDHPSLAVKILNGTPTPILPSRERKVIFDLFKRERKKERERESERKREREGERERERKRDRE